MPGNLFESQVWAWTSSGNRYMASWRSKKRWPSMCLVIPCNRGSSHATVDILLLSSATGTSALKKNKARRSTTPSSLLSIPFDFYGAVCLLVPVICLTIECDTTLYVVKDPSKSLSPSSCAPEGLSSVLELPTRRGHPPSCKQRPLWRFRLPSAHNQSRKAGSTCCSLS